MNEWDELWSEHSRLMDRMMDTAAKEAKQVSADTQGAIRVTLTFPNLWDLMRGHTLLFKTNEYKIMLRRRP